MRVVIVSQWYDQVLPPDQNSIGIWTYEVGRRLADAHDLTVVARRPPRRMPPLLGVEFDLRYIWSAPFVWSVASRAWAKALPGRQPIVSKAFYALDYFAQILLELRRRPPDLVHLQNVPQFAPLVRRILPSSAIVLHMHCDWLAQFNRNAAERSIAAADFVVGCSRHVVEGAKQRFPGASVGFAVLPNGATSLESAVKRVPGKVMFVGRVSPEKGVHVLLEAWPQIVAEFPQARLEIVGPAAETPRQFLVDLSDNAEVADLSRFYSGGREFRGSYDASLRSLVPSKVAHTVTFVGHLPHQQVIERLAGATLLVNPSLSESFGMSLVEAMAAGTAVVATRVGGMPEIMEATGGGLLVEKNDANALAAAIVHMLSRPEKCAAVGRHGAMRVEALYAWPRIAALASELHHEAMARRRFRAGQASLA